MESTWDRLRRVFARDIRGAQDQIRAYPDEASIWACPPGVNNSSGTLALHLAGNLRAFIGAGLGGSGYVRQRDLEFSARDVARDELLQGLDVAASEVDAALAQLTDANLERPFPFPPEFKLTVSTPLFLDHLATHLAYHVGQMDYHRRMVTGEATAAPVLSIKALTA